MKLSSSCIRNAVSSDLWTIFPHEDPGVETIGPLMKPVSQTSSSSCLYIMCHHISHWIIINYNIKHPKNKQTVNILIVQMILCCFLVSLGIVLSWNMSFNPREFAEIATYQLFAYQEGSAPPSTSLWKKVGAACQSVVHHMVNVTDLYPESYGHIPDVNVCV